MTERLSTARCGGCAHFIDEPRELERSLAGLTILSSAWGDTRGDQGLCGLLDLFLQPAMGCRHFIDRRVESETR